LSGVAALAVVLSAAAGIAGAVQAAVMGELGERVGIVPAVAFSAVVTAVLGISALLASQRGLGGLSDVLREPAWLWIGGALSLFIVIAITVGPPRIGTTATIGIVVAGNLVMAAVVDSFGLFGLERIALSWPRLLGIVLLAVGAALSLHKGG
jgi:bacterial/archaeal transporter family-2 protein